MMRYRLGMLVVVLAMCACGGSRESVVIYTALDEMYSRPILDQFEEQTGIEVKAVYDTEASKTTGLVTRLIAEKGRPRADVFWNNEIAQTIVLKERGVLAPYDSPAAELVPEKFKDPEHYWTGLAGRARVLIYNTELMDAPPESIHDLLDPKWKGQAAIALPLFGTTATHAAALWAHWGAEETKQFFEDLKANEVATLAGNATVRDFVVQGEYVFGLTDTDDANSAIVDGAPVEWVLPDQDGMGTLLIPNTVAVIADSPNPKAAQQLVDYLLSPEVEATLAASRSLQIPLKGGVETPDNVPQLSSIKTMPVTYVEIAEQMQPSAEYVREQFLDE